MFYLNLFRALQKHEVRYVVVGGIAINLHGVERATMDADLVLAMDQDNLARFLKVASDLALKPLLPVKIEALCDAQQIDEWVREKHMLAFNLRPTSPTLPSVDILVQPKVPFETLYCNRIKRDFGDVQFSIASIDDLIAMKAGTGRKQDASDIIALNKVKSVLHRRID
jgi:hypothetical protein